MKHLALQLFDFKICWRVLLATIEGLQSEIRQI